MADNQAIDVDEVQEGKPAKKVRKAAGGGGKPPLMMIASLAVAVAAIAFSALLFMQLNGLKSKLEDSGTLAVPGEEDAATRIVVISLVVAFAALFASEVLARRVAKRIGRV